MPLKTFLRDLYDAPLVSHWNRRQRGLRKKEELLEKIASQMVLGTALLDRLTPELSHSTFAARLLRGRESLDPKVSAGEALIAFLTRLTASADPITFVESPDNAIALEDIRYHPVAFAVYDREFLKIVAVYRTFQQAQLARGFNPEAIQIKRFMVTQPESVAGLVLGAIYEL